MNLSSQRTSATGLAASLRGLLLRLGLGFRLVLDGRLTRQLLDEKKGRHGRIGQSCLFSWLAHARRIPYRSVGTKWESDKDKS